MSRDVIKMEGRDEEKMLIRIELGAKVAINAAAAGKVDAIACNHPA